MESVKSAHPELPDSDPVYDDLLPGVDGGAGPRPAAPRMPDAGAHLVIVPGSLTRHPLNSSSCPWIVISPVVTWMLEDWLQMLPDLIRSTLFTSEQAGPPNGLEETLEEK